MDKGLLSVIVPIYNIEDYLSKCIDSIIGSNYKELEIILVDDGSSDESGEICDEYSKQDSRIKVIHKKNGGLVSARKAGVSVVSGSYVTFVDGDDFVDPDLYEKAMKTQFWLEADMLCFGYQESDQDGKAVSVVLNDLTSGIYKSLDVSKYIKDGSLSFIHAAWNKIYKAELLKKAIIQVNDSVIKGEDLNLTLSYLALSDSFCINNSFHEYNYVNRSSSITHSYDSRSIEHTSEYIKSSMKLADYSDDCNDEWKKLIYNEAFGLVMSNCIGCALAHYGKMGLFSILSYFKKITDSEEIKHLFEEGIRSSSFDQAREKFARLVIRKHYVRAFLMRILKQVV